MKKSTQPAQRPTPLTNAAIFVANSTSHGQKLVNVDFARDLERRNAKLAEQCLAKQKEALKIAQQNGFVFDDIGAEPGNWKHLAFTYYTALCELSHLAEQALAQPATKPTNE